MNSLIRLLKGYVYSLEHVIDVVKRVLRYFFHFSLSRIIFFTLGVYWIYRKEIEEILENAISIIPWNDININTVLEIGNLFLFYVY